MKIPKNVRLGEKLVLRCFLATEDIPANVICAYAPRSYLWGTCKVRLMANKHQRTACGTIRRVKKGQKMWGITEGRISIQALAQEEL